MRLFWSDPYLWIHLAGLAVVPISLELCLIGLATGDPILPSWLEILIIAVIGIGPVLWMQWQRPFSIFCLIAVALQPTVLTEDQRRLLTLFKSQRNQILALIVAVVMFGVLTKLYGIAPIATDRISLLGNSHLLGLLLAAIAFLLANLFTQVPVSVLGVIAHSDAVVAGTAPYPTDQISQDFSLLGLRVNKILPRLISTPVFSTPGSGTVQSTIAPNRLETSSTSQPIDSQSLTESISEAEEPDPWIEE